MMKPQVLAPGVSIRSSVPGSDTAYEDGWSGTSMSAPHVTGLVALIWQAAPCLVGQYAATETLIEGTAVDMTYNDGSPLTPDDFPNFATGWGEIDALAAVNQASGMCAMGTLQGTVTSDGTTPLEGVMIFADNGAGFTKKIYSMADGTFSTGLTDGTYTLTATKYGYEAQTVSDVVIVEDETTIQNFTMPQLEMSLISGIVYDGGVEGLGEHGYPLYSSIRIQTPGFDETIFTDPFSGYYEIEVVSETELTFTTTPVPGGYDPLVETVTASGEAYTHDIFVPVDGAVCAAPGYQPDYDFFYSFESSNEGFTAGGTTSFAWGDFTSGPMAGHSGTKGIATNPGGDYNASELGWMASPVIDLSANDTNSTAIQWWDWKDIESASYDWARLDVTKDGGTTWITVWGPVGGVTDTEYHQQTVVLDSSYNVSNFQFRFYFKSDSSVQYEGWYVDDIGIFTFAIPPETVIFEEDFNATNGGFVASGTPAIDWQWGIPSTTFPGPCPDGNCWDTVLAGNYSSSTDQTLASPAIDLSGVALPPGNTLYLKWWQAVHVESNTWDDAWAEISADGTTWTTMWANPSSTITEQWNQKAYDISSFVGDDSVYLRFRMTSDTLVQYEGYSVDHIKVSYQEPIVIPSPECTMIPGGVVAGYVLDDNDDSPIVAADVYSDVVETQSFFIPEDPISEGLFWVFHPTMTDTEDVDFTASKALYGSDTATVSIDQDAINQQDFYLGTGELSFAPTEFEVTMYMGDAPVTQTLTISNNGSSDAMFELVEKDEGFELPTVAIPAFEGKLPEDNRPVSIGRAPEAANTSRLQSSGENPFKGLLAGAPAFAVDAYPGENLVYFPDTSAPGSWNVVGSLAGTEFFAGDFVGGDFDTLYVINSTGNTLYGVNTTTAATTLIGTATPPAGQSFSGLSGTPFGEMYGLTTTCAGSNLVMVDVTTGATTDLGALPGIDCGIDLAYNTDDGMIYIVDLVTDSLFRVDPATVTVTLVGALGASPNYAQGMDYEEESGILYWAAYTTVGELRIIDTTTGASTLVGGFPGGAEVDSFAFATGGQSDVPWLSEDPVSGIVTSTTPVEVTVTFDPTSAGLSQPGNYLAALKVKHDTPYVYPDIPVVLHLMAPDDYGTFNGYVMGLEACDVNPAALEGATINFWQGGSIAYTTTTNAEGYYSYAVPEGVYDIEVMADGYISQIQFGLEVLGGSTIPVDFTLRLEASCINVDPTSLEQTQVTDTQTTQTLTVTNTGAGDGVFELIELPVAGILADQLLQDPSFEAYTPNPYWDEYSENYGTPLCTEDDCGLGGGSGPRTGEAWSWFGGSSTGDSGYVSQDVMVLPGTAEMTFWVEQAVCGTSGVSNYMALKIDGTELWRTDGTDPACGTASYREITVDVSDFADGDTHEIMFDSVTIGNGNFFLDDVELNLEAGGDVLWLSEDPIAGVVPGDDFVNVTITYDSTGLAEGDYFATLRVKNPPATAINVPVTLHVVPNSPPVAEDQTVSTPENTPIDITLVATDADGNELTYEVVDPPLHGSVVIAEDVATYTPDVGYIGPDSFTFKANDGMADSNVATVSITIFQTTRFIYLPLILK